MSFRDVTPPPLRPTLADAVHTDCHETRRLIVAHVRKQEEVRTAFWTAASKATLDRRPAISAASKPKVGGFR